MRTVRETQPLDNALMIIGKSLISKSLIPLIKMVIKQDLIKLRRISLQLILVFYLCVLKSLNKSKVIEKHLILGTPVKTEYSLTKKATLIDIIDKLKNWGKMIG